jgi:very-short-patch-repair endonuclease
LRQAAEVPEDWRRVARRQGGVITRRQLGRLGRPVGEVEHLLQVGELTGSTRRGVYRVAGAPHTPNAARWIAVLATRAPLSHFTAAEVWELDLEGDGRLHVIAPLRRRTRMPAGVRVHRVLLGDADHTTWLATPITTRRRTVLDCLGLLPRRTARMFLDRAVQQGWVDLSDVEGRLRHHTGMRGNTQLRVLLQECSEGTAESERRLHRILRRARIGGWQPNVVVVTADATFEVDVLFADEMVAIEVDGYAYHSDVGRFRADRRKQNALIAGGYTVLRFTWADLVERPGYVVATISTVVATRSTRNGTLTANS